jgi:hypothetical protein
MGHGDYRTTPVCADYATGPLDGDSCAARASPVVPLVPTSFAAGGHGIMMTQDGA